MIPSVKKKIAVAVAASLSISGCIPAVRFRPCPPQSAVQCELPTAQSVSLQASLPVNANAPFVRIVGESAPYANFPELELLAAELHSELAFRGGVRLEDSALVAQEPMDYCDSSLSCVAGIRRGEMATGENDSSDAQSDNGGIPESNESPTPTIKTMSAQLMDNPGPPASYVNCPTTLAAAGMPFPGGSSFEVGVIVNDFTPYRPMQLAATFVVRDLSSGQEIHRIQRVWRGILHEPEFETTRKRLNSDLRHPATRQRLEHTALPDISPRHLIKRAATEVADSLQQSVLQPPQPISGQYLSAPQGFHPQP